MIINPAVVNTDGYKVKSQLSLPAQSATPSSTMISGTGRTFISGTDTIRCFVSPKTANGTYISRPFAGGSWANGNAVLALVHSNGSSQYTANRYAVHNQTRSTTSPQFTNANLLWYGVTFVVSPTRAVVNASVQNASSGATSASTVYYLSSQGDFRFLYLCHTRTENGATTTIAHFLPATDGTDSGYIDIVTNTFYPVSGATTQ